MKILINDYVGHPFQYELSQELASRGHEVHHAYCSTTITPQTSFTDPDVTTYAITTDRTFSKYDVRKRVVDELRYGWRSVKVARHVRPDRLITSNAPVLSLVVLWLWALTSRTRWVLWLQDIQSGIAGMVMGRRHMAIRVLGVVERWLIRRAWRVVVISGEFRSEVLRFGANAERVTLIENWAPLDDVPDCPRKNWWSAAHGLDGQFVFLYSGTLGVKHNPELLLALADEFARDDEVRVVVVSEGIGADWLREQNSRRPRSNLMLLPFQAFTDLPNVLASADVLVVLLDPAAGIYSVPSKSLTYMCAGRAILAALPEENAAARLLADRASAGVCVAPGDTAELLAAAHKLRADTSWCDILGRNARRYAETTFDRRAMGDRFEDLLGLKGKRM